MSLNSCLLDLPLEVITNLERLSCYSVVAFNVEESTNLSLVTIQFDKFQFVKHKQAETQVPTSISNSNSSSSSNYSKIDVQWGGTDIQTSCCHDDGCGDNDLEIFSVTEPSDFSCSESWDGCHSEYSEVETVSVENRNYMSPNRCSLTTHCDTETHHHGSSMLGANQHGSTMSGHDQDHSEVTETYHYRSRTHHPGSSKSAARYHGSSMTFGANEHDSLMPGASQQGSEMTAAHPYGCMSGTNHHGSLMSGSQQIGSSLPGAFVHGANEHRHCVSSITTYRQYYQLAMKNVNYHWNKFPSRETGVFLIRQMKPDTMPKLCYQASAQSKKDICGPVTVWWLYNNRSWLPEKLRRQLVYRILLKTIPLEQGHNMDAAVPVRKRELIDILVF